MDSHKKNEQRRQTMEELYCMIRNAHMEMETKYQMLMYLADEQSKAMDRMNRRIKALEEKHGNSIGELLVNQHETLEQTADRLIKNFIKRENQ